MRKFIQVVVSAIAPVLGVSFAILVMRFAEVPFPPALAWESWAQWLIFCALVYMSTAFVYYVAGRVGGVSTEARSQPAPH